MDDRVGLATVEKLVSLSRDDWKYSDLYLREAEVAMTPLCSREQFRALLSQRSAVRRLRSELERAIKRRDWPKAEKLAADGSELGARVECDRHLLAVAKTIYGARSVQASTTALALSGTVAHPARLLERELAQLCRDLRALAEEQTSSQSLCERRARELERMAVDLPEDPPPRIEPTGLRDAALDAVEEGDFDAALRIARSALRSGQDRMGRIRAPKPSSTRARRLAEPIPDGAIERAALLGLEPMKLEPNADFNAYLSCSCADRVDFPSFPLSAERRETDGCTCGHACPPDVGDELRSSLDALMIHPFLNSGGTRYLPWFGAEHVLIETFPEDEPDARTPLLESLSLPHRRALSRLAIEDALLSRGPDVCEQLGLDPTTYRITCVPFDVYLRAAVHYGWGGRERWTHFDGYQVTRELKLRALVGGDVRYGGSSDLCGVERAYDSAHLTARFAILQRDRFEARVQTGQI